MIKHLALLLCLIGCQTQGPTPEDFFNLQTRLIKVEKKFNSDTSDAKSKEENTNRNIASTTAQLDKIRSEVEIAKGDIDALKVGVRTGQMPGEQPTDSSPSLAGQISELKTRLEALEAAQAEVLKTLAQQSSIKSSSKKSANLGSVDSFKSAFTSKKYSQIAEEAPAKIKSLSGKSQQELKFIYAESLYKLSRYSDAALVYNELIKEKALSDKQPQIYLRIADSFRLLKDKEAAQVYYKELIEKFPNAEEEVDRAKKQIDQSSAKISKKRAAF